MPATHAESLQKVYKEVSQGYESAHAKDAETTLLQLFLSLLPTEPEILDLGAGNGRDSKYFADSGANVTMFDLSPEMLELAQQKVPDATIVIGDMTEMHFPAATFEGVWANASLLHLTKEECLDVLKRIHGILKPDGALYVRVKKGSGEKEVDDTKYGKPMTRFFAFYEQGELEEMLRQAKFTIVDSAIIGVVPKQWVRILARKS